jgi:hypothetical protein
MGVPGSPRPGGDRCHILIAQPVPQRTGELRLDVGTAGCCCSTETLASEDQCVTPPEGEQVGIEDVYLCP